MRPSLKLLCVAQVFLLAPCVVAARDGFQSAPAAQAGPSAPARPELMVQLGHTLPINDIAVSPDGRWIASGSDDTSVKIWEVSTGRVLRTLAGHVEDVHTVAISPDGGLLASAGKAGTIIVWDPLTGEVLRTLTGHQHWVMSLAFSPDGKFLASGSRDRLIAVWDAAAMKRRDTPNTKAVHVLEGHTDTVWGLTFNPSGKILVSSGRDNKQIVWDVVAGEPLSKPESTNSDTVVFSADGRFMVESGLSIRVWDLSKPELIHEKLDGISPVALSSDGSLLVSGSEEKAVKLWDVKTGKLIGATTQHEGYIRGLSFGPGDAWIASGSEDRTIKIWDLRARREARTFSGRGGGVPEVAVSPDGRYLAAPHINSPTALWDFRKGQQVKALPADGAAVAFNPTSEVLMTDGAGGESSAPVALWDISKGQEPRSLPADHLKSCEGGFTVSPDGRTMACRQMGRVVVVLDYATGRTLHTLTHQENLGQLYFAAEFSPDNKYLATAAQDGLVRVWNVQTGREHYTLTAHQTHELQQAKPDETTLMNLPMYVGGAFSVAFSPDGKFVATSGGDRTVKIWHTATRTLFHTLKDGDNIDNAVAFDPTGTLLATAGADKTVRVWDVRTGLPLQRLTGHAGGVQSLRFIPGASLLVSGSMDGTVNVWDPKKGELLLTLASLGDADWLAVTPEGLFDGSPAAWDQIAWRFSPNTFDIMPVEAFYNDFYRPGLLTDVMTGQRPKPDPGIKCLDCLDRRQPTVKLTTAAGPPAGAEALTERAFKLRVEIAEETGGKPGAKGSGARDVRLFRNGSLIKVWRGDAFKLGGADGCRQEGPGRAVCEVTVAVTAGENQLMAYAFNEDNIKSKSETLVVRGADSLSRAGTLYVIAVGVDKYNNAAYPDLQFAVADARAFGEEMRRQQQGLGVFRAVEVVQLFDEAATSENVLLALRRLAGADVGQPAGPVAPLRPATPEDVVMLYFAGHGTAERDRFHLVTRDTERRISDHDLELAFERVDARRILLVIDACESGQALEAVEKRRGPMNSRGLAQLAYEKGMYVLTAAQSAQAALEVSELGHGLLTYALVVEGLRRGRAEQNEKGEVTERRWLDYAAWRVPQMQVEQMRKRDGELRDGRAKGRSKLVFVLGDDPEKDPEKRGLQTPRVFYRRELEAQPLVIARPEASQRP